MNKWLRRALLAVYLPAVQNLVLILQQIKSWLLIRELPMVVVWQFLLLAAILLLLPGMYLHLAPARDKVLTALRLRVMLGGRSLIYCGLYGMAAQAAVFFGLYPRLWAGEGMGPVSIPGLIINGVWAVAAVFLFLANGVVRIFCTSRRLSIVRRLVMLLTMWIPLVNLGVLLYACRLVYEEYDFEREGTQSFVPPAILFCWSMASDFGICVILTTGAGFPGSLSEMGLYSITEIRRPWER